MYRPHVVFSELYKNQVLKQIYLVIGSLKHINLHYYCKLEVCCVKSLEQELNSDEDVAGAAIEAADDHSADTSQGTNAAVSSASYSNSKKREIPAAVMKEIHSLAYSGDKNAFAKQFSLIELIV